MNGICLKSSAVCHLQKSADLHLPKHVLSKASALKTGSTESAKVASLI